MLRSSLVCHEAMMVPLLGKHEAAWVRIQILIARQRHLTYLFLVQSYVQLTSQLARHEDQWSRTVDFFQFGCADPVIAGVKRRCNCTYDGSLPCPKLVVRFTWTTVPYRLFLRPTVCLSFCILFFLITTECLPFSTTY